MKTDEYNKSMHDLQEAVSNFRNEQAMRNDLYNYYNMFPNMDIKRIRSFYENNPNRPTIPGSLQSQKRGGRIKRRRLRGVRNRSRNLNLEEKMALENQKFSHKIALSNLSFEQRKHLTQVKEALKAISENNKQVRKSLLKIFK